MSSYASKAAPGGAGWRAGGGAGPPSTGPGRALAEAPALPAELWQLVFSKLPQADRCVALAFDTSILLHPYIRHPVQAHACPPSLPHTALRRVAGGRVCKAWRAISLETALWTELAVRVDRSDNVGEKLKSFRSFLFPRKGQVPG